VLGASGGPEWACVGACIGYGVHSVGTIVAACAVTEVPVGPYLAGVLRPLVACVPMFAAVSATAAALAGQGVPPLASLIVELAVGGVVYVASALVLVRSTALELLRLRRTLLRRRPAGE
jgi:lipopolysaccharide exporter